MSQTIKAGGLDFLLENRRVGEDGGPSLQVLANVEDEVVQMLRFDMFEKRPHYHYAPNAQNLEYELDPLTLGDDGIKWAIGLIGSRLPELVAKAGYGGVVSPESASNVIAALPEIEAKWRTEKPVVVRTNV